MALNEIKASAPNTEGINEISPVKLELFLTLIFDGYNTDKAQEKIKETIGFVRENDSKTSDSFKLNLQISAADNPNGKISSNENLENELSKHLTFKVKVNGESKFSYNKQIKKSLLSIKDYIQRYIINPDVYAMDIHFYIVCYNQGNIISNIINSIGIDKSDEIVKKELASIFDFKKYFYHEKIKYCKVDSISVLDIVAKTADLIGDTLKGAAGLLYQTGVAIKNILWNNPISKLLTGRGNLFGKNDDEVNKRYFPTKDRITVFDAAVMCQHTYQSELPQDKSVFSIIDSLKGNNTTLADTDQVAIFVDEDIETNVRNYLGKISKPPVPGQADLSGGINSNSKLSGKIKTIDGWIPVNQNDEVMGIGLNLVSHISGLFSKIYKRVDANGNVYYVYCTAGTEPLSFNDWVFANLLQGLTGLSLQHTQSVKNAKKLNKFCKKHDYYLFFVGHSLGGGLASNNAIITEDKHAITFNAAGLHPFRVGASLLLNNPKGYFKHAQRVSRVHPFIIDGEAVQILRFIGQPAMNAENANRYYDDTEIAMSQAVLSNMETSNIDVIKGEPIVKLGHLNTIAKHTVENFLRIKELETLEILE